VSGGAAWSIAEIRRRHDAYGDTEVWLGDAVGFLLAALDTAVAARDFGPTMTLTLPHVPGVTGWTMTAAPPAEPACGYCGCTVPAEQCTACDHDDPHAPVEVRYARWDGEVFTDDDGTVGVPLTVDGKPVYLTLDGDAPALLGEQLTTCHETNNRKDDE
jgi:hypothetical protein